jgi:hypothetical protein
MKERHILGPEADPDRLDEWLLGLGFERVLDQSRAHLFPRLLRWRSEATTVTWIEDHMRGVRCVEIHGLPLVGAPIPTLSTPELLAISGHDADARRALEYLEATDLEFWKSSADS